MDVIDSITTATRLLIGMRPQDKGRMYTVGSLFYAIYFFVSFPMFYHMDESPRRHWKLKEAVLDSLSACMLVTCLLDFWRLSLGAVWDSSSSVGECYSAGGQGLPWLPQERMYKSAQHCP